MDSTNIHHNHNKDYRTNILDNYQCDEYIFCSNFDSGNLGKVELVKKCPETEFGENIVHVEFNVWTTPDCYGTPHESPNRTWFFFSIKGGRPYRNIKINVKNLNRQSKLFGQGMQPVIRIGHFGKWERIKNKPTYNMEEENFSMSFIHQPMDKCDIEHFYAFTYPFTYSECQTILEKFDKKYSKNLNEINFIINKLKNTENEETTTSSRTTMVTIITSQRTIRKTSNESCNKNFISDKIIENDNNLIKECNMDGTDNQIMPATATSSIEAFKEITTTESGKPYEKLTRKQLLNEIYYHREPLINSLEGRRIDLLTITSFHGIQNIREERLSNLFPDSDCLRCHTFKDKKIIFMSSRVHPGETPASFVLNGFLNLILDKKSTIAHTLRQLYVFKIVPILNPDGVYRGFYRTDTLGQNLNRMYVNPKLEIHPSIYAVKKLIKYYHFGFDSGDTSENSNEEVSSSSSTSSRSIDLPIKSNDENGQQTNESNSNETEEPLMVEIKLESQSCSLKESSTVTATTLSSSSSSEIEENQKSTILNRFPETTTTPTIPTIEIKTPKTFTETLIPEIKTHVANDETTIKTMSTIKPKKSSSSIGNNNNNNNRSENKVKKITIKTMLAGHHHHHQSLGGIHNSNNSHRNTENKLKNNNNSLSVVQQQQQRSHNKRINIRKDTKNSNITKSHTLTSSTSNRSLNKRNILSNHNTNNSGTSTTNLDFTMMKKMNIEKGGGNSRSGNCIGEENTNMFLYIDFHGHASKKGVFMYGNHFSNSAEAVECMLLPRLMSINCHHFHYDACNFSERNMYRREKRDGLSKEGSGRVAIFKMTGLIKSYTLESNYNTGRYINNLPARGKDTNSNHSTKSINLTPPKYTPAIYEEVGRALGPSILDITNSNTLSRIHNSEFRTIQGLRITLRNEIERGFTNSHRNQTSSSTATNASVVTTSKALTAQQNIVKRIKRNARSASSALPQNDTSKENKVLYSMSWDTTNPSTSMLIKSQTVVGTQSKQLQIKLQRNSLNGNGNGGNGINCNNNNNTNKKSNHLIRVRSNSAPLYGVAGCSKEFKKKSTKALIESPSSNSSCVVTSFFIPPKKVKVSNKNTIFKGNMMKSIIPLPPPMPPSLQPPPLLQSSSLMQNKVNNTNNCLNCDLNNQSCQTDNHYHSSSSSPYYCKNSLSADEIQNQMMPSCSNVVVAASSTNVDNNPAIAVPSSSSSSKIFAHTASCSQSTSSIPISSNSFRKGRKTELLSSSSAAVNLFNIKNNSIRARSAAATLTNISSNNEKNLNIIKMKSSFSARKKRTIRRETIIIKRKKNKLKSTIH